MTPSELKYLTEETEPFFFTRKTMKFFGDTMKNYGVRSNVIINTLDEKVEVWELYRKKPVNHGISNSAYFKKGTFEQTFNKD